MQPGIEPAISRLYVAHATTEPRRPTQEDGNDDEKEVKGKDHGSDREGEDEGGDKVYCLRYNE